MGRLIQYVEDVPAHCRHCRYYLAGLPHVGVCPECGRAYDKSEPVPMTMGEAARDLPRALVVWLRDSRRRLAVWVLANVRALWITAVILGTSAVVITFGAVAWAKFFARITGP